MSAKLFKKVNSSEYIHYKKSVAIAGTALTNPIKTNDKQYNQNFKFIPALTTAVDSSNCLIYSKNYELLNDYETGLNYRNIICDLSANIKR